MDKLFAFQSRDMKKNTPPPLLTRLDFISYNKANIIILGIFVKNILKVILFVNFMIAGTANAAFMNYYDAANWSIKGAAGADTIRTSNAASASGNAAAESSRSGTVLMNTSNNSGGWLGERFTIAAPKSGMVSFKWTYHTDDSRGAAWDRFGIWLNGKYTVLNDILHSPTHDQSGTYSFAVSKGDIFGFKANSQDSLNGKATIELSNFKAPALVPLPAAAWLMFVPLMGTLAKRRKAV
ncbi:MAG: hypothetical protein ABL933_11345 [Methyloglobulus sp.]|nr:hypothetical protein [Methyloglobulus sp.]